MGDTKQNLNDTKALLRRGGRSLGLAALAHYHHLEPADPKWNVLAPELSAPAEEILQLLETQQNPVALDMALKHAMSPKSSTSPPSWVTTLLDSSQLIERFSTTVMQHHHHSRPLEEIFPKIRTLNLREQTLQIVAVALCRNLDTVRSLQDRLTPDEATVLWRTACLAAVTVPSGFPSSLRELCRQLVLGDLA